MVTPEQLAGLIAVLRADTPTGPIDIEVDGLKVRLPGKAVVAGPASEAPPTRAPLTYEQLMMAATEGLPEEDVEPPHPAEH